MGMEVVFRILKIELLWYLPEDPEERMVGMAGRNVLLFQGEVSRPDLLDIKGPSEASSSITWAIVV